MLKPISLNRDAAKWDPEAEFESPEEVAGHVLLTRAEKLSILDRWRTSILSELAAIGEGMATRGLSSKRLRLLASVEQVRAKLRP